MEIGDGDWWRWRAAGRIGIGAVEGLDDGVGGVVDCGPMPSCDAST